jgi:hypothetical protein
MEAGTVAQRIAKLNNEFDRIEMTHIGLTGLLNDSHQFEELLQRVTHVNVADWETAAEKAIILENSKEVLEERIYGLKEMKVLLKLLYPKGIPQGTAALKEMLSKWTSAHDELLQLDLDQLLFQKEGEPSLGEVTIQALEVKEMLFKLAN